MRDVVLIQPCNTRATDPVKRANVGVVLHSSL